MYPALNLNRLHSVSFTENISILFEDIKSINKDNLLNCIRNNNSDNISIITDKFTIFLNEKLIVLKGIRINHNTFYINSLNTKEDEYSYDNTIKYNISNKDIFAVIEYLYNYVH